MLRMRRPRIILILAVFTLFLLFHFKSIPDGWSREDSRIVSSGSTPANNDESMRRPAAPADVKEEGAKGPVQALEATTTSTSTTSIAREEKTTAAAEVAKPTILAPGDDGHHLLLDTHAPPNKPAHAETANKHHQAAPPAQTIAGTAAGGPQTTSTYTISHIHWTKVPEHFPVPTESIIPLPVGKEKKLPKIQADFKDESALEQSDRAKRQARIKKVFKKSWDGYVQHAWLHDELRPESGLFKDPFCGWAATLVDSLDSLLILGLEEEFEHALTGLERIDFTTTPFRNEIPLFETVIRYLGGLLSAYDLDHGKHKIILDKAVELAEVLMGAFDTPNRMPQTFYQWKPVYLEQPKRARTRVVMAELGSLSMEFTRLAQITKNDKYYDAIARITNEFEVWQDNTKIPGLFPLSVDASGCKKSNVYPDPTWTQKVINFNNHAAHDNLDTNEARDPALANVTVPAATTTIVAAPQLSKNKATAAADDAAPVPFDYEANKGKIKNWDSGASGLAGEAGKESGKGSTAHVNGHAAAVKRQLDNVVGGGSGAASDKGSSGLIEDTEYENGPLGAGPKLAAAAKEESKVDCVPQGLASPPGSYSEDFSFAGQADSTYEYMPKQHLLLGGQVDQYQKMYEKAIAAANKYMLFRPMLPDEEDIRILGDVKATDDVSKPGSLNLQPKLSHLLCFAGGMYGLGAKVFQRPQDLEMGMKMTDACVWAYGMTKTGIMPEDFHLLECDHLDKCPWNQTKWEYTLDPFPETRMGDGLRMVKPAAMPAPPLSEAEDETSGSGAAGTHPHQGIESRQLGGIDNDINHAGRGANRMHYLEQKASQDGTVMGHGPGTPTVDDTGARKPMNQKEYVAFVEELRDLPRGVPYVDSAKYILRPEAIESVFYMYRITGDPSWREKGWRMWEAVESATDSKYGASAIMDVMAASGSINHLDEMESFWLAETLKYFYLLFSTPDTISLDEYVLNTEAHPFRRPKPAA